MVGAVNEGMGVREKSCAVERQQRSLVVVVGLVSKGRRA